MSNVESTSDSGKGVEGSGEPSMSVSAASTSELGEFLEEVDLKKRHVTTREEAADIVQGTGGFDVYYDPKSDGYVVGIATAPDDMADSSSSDMTREEINAKLGEAAAKAENERSKMDAIATEIRSDLRSINDRMGHMEDKQELLRDDVRSTRSTFVLGTLALAALLVTLIGLGYSRLGGIEDRVVENIQRIEQLAQYPQSGGPEPRASTDTSGQ